MSFARAGSSPAFGTNLGKMIRGVDAASHLLEKASGCLGFPGAKASKNKNFFRVCLDSAVLAK